MTRIAVVIPAGGAGRRMGGVAKPLIELGGESLLERSVRPFLARDDVHWVIIALPVELAAAPPHWLMSDRRIDIVAGGAERGDSVRNALSAVPMEADIVLVHDAARPLVSAEVIERCINAAAGGRSAIAAIPVVDTVKEVDEGGRVTGTPDRRTLWAAQTPQAFPAEVLRNAHARAAADNVSTTDDAALVTRYGGAVVVVEGAPENLKVTTPVDLKIIAALLDDGE
ncbi:MAG TPA: 2-C-methyl-D-erythritol 4-phosphate cytidylyltransferase [Longimicrobiales bacterium]|nr:2-C-methyl-D-erythritol 4-phosphate cytidylyltransferase [Longimicrobiales bacterium]